jgi:ATP-dependent DNA helicase RecG
MPAPATERLRPDSPLTVLAGVGPKAAQALAASGLRTLRDLLLLFPRRVRDVVAADAPRDELVGRIVRIRARVEGVRRVFLPRRQSLVTLRMRAPGGQPFQVTYFNQPYLGKAFAPGEERVVVGTLQKKAGRFTLPQARAALPAAVQETCEVVYPEIEGIGELRLRRWIASALERLAPESWRDEPLPGALAAEYPTSFASLLAMHRPRDVAEHERARRAFAVREAAALFTRVERARQARLQRRSPRIGSTPALEARLAARRPFRLTGDQQAAIRRIATGLRGPAPLGILLQGDVGTGKTAVALDAALRVIAAGHQVAFLAPTELLAEQHDAVVREWLRGSRVRQALLAGSMPSKQRAEIEAGIASGAIQLVFGTHALFSQATRFRSLGLVVIDEQHRFGVEQRMALVHKGKDPHVLVLTATPIPRTLALTLFGDLDLVTLHERPPGSRIPRAVHVAPERWARVLHSLERCVRRGGRAYVVCSRIGEEGDEGGATARFAELSVRFRCALVHGEQKAEERQAAVDAFRSGRAQVLVGTTVVEVGVDVPQATLVVIADADRLGLATLHQLRGRAGRGARRGLCIAVGNKTERVAALCSTTDGFVLAEKDLALRGAGELLGTAQSGLADLRALDPVEDYELLRRVRDAVKGEPR